MVKKMKSTTTKASSQATDSVSHMASAAAAQLLDSQLANSVKESAQQIWLAGMGAFSNAREEGTKVFETLVKEGQNLQKKTQGLAEDKINEVTGKMSAMADTVTAKAGQNWDKLESIFEQRTAKAMNKLGVPTAKDVDALVQRVDQLAAAVAKLSRAAGSSKPGVTRTVKRTVAPVAVKTAAKRAAKSTVKVADKGVAKVIAPKAPFKRARKAATA